MLISVAGLIVDITPRYELLKSRLNNYVTTENKTPDIVIDLSEKFYEDRQKENPSLTLDECECLYSASYFYTELAKFNGVMLHASAVQYKNYAYLFSANSGTGKSTHTHLWLEKFPTAEILNDDKPAIRLIDGKFYAFGTPWSGKFDESINTGTEIAGITFLSRGEKNEIEQVSGESVMLEFLNQTVRPVRKEYMIAFLDVLDKILSNVPVYRLKCNVSIEAVDVSYEKMKPRS